VYHPRHSVFSLLERALDPADQTLAAEAGQSVRRNFARNRYQVVLACLAEIKAEADWSLVQCRANRAQTSDYSTLKPYIAYWKLRAGVAYVRAFSYATLILTLPPAAPLQQFALRRLRASLPATA